MTIFDTHNRYKYIYQHVEVCEDECSDELTKLHNTVDKGHIDCIKQMLLEYYSTKPEFSILKERLINSKKDIATIMKEQQEHGRNMNDITYFKQYNNDEKEYNYIDKTLSENASALAHSAYGSEIDSYIGNPKALEKLSKTNKQKYNHIKDKLSECERRLYMRCYSNENMQFHEDIKDTDSIEKAKHSIVNDIMSGYQYIPKERSYDIYTALNNIKDININTYYTFFEEYMKACSNQKANINIINDKRFQPLLECMNDLLREDKKISIDIHSKKSIQIAHALELKSNNKEFYPLKKDDIDNKIRQIQEKVECMSTIEIATYASQLEILAGVLESKAGHIYQLESWYAPGFMSKLTISSQADKDTLYSHFNEAVEKVCTNTNIISFPNGDTFEIPKDGVYDKNTMPESIVINDSSYSTEAFLNEYKRDPEGTLHKYNAIKLGTIEDTVLQTLLNGDIVDMNTIGHLMNKEVSMAYQIENNYSFNAQIKKEGKALAITNNVLAAGVNIGAGFVPVAGQVDDCHSLYEVYTNEDVKRLADVGLVDANKVDEINAYRVASGGIAVIGLLPGGDALKYFKKLPETLEAIGKTARTVSDMRGATALKYAIPTATLMAANTFDAQAGNGGSDVNDVIAYPERSTANANWYLQTWLPAGSAVVGGLTAVLLGRKVFKNLRGRENINQINKKNTDKTIEKIKDIKAQTLNKPDYNIQTTTTTNIVNGTPTTTTIGDEKDIKKLLQKHIDYKANPNYKGIKSTLENLLDDDEQDKIKELENMITQWDINNPGNTAPQEIKDIFKKTNNGPYAKGLEEVKKEIETKLNISRGEKTTSTNGSSHTNSHSNETNTQNINGHVNQSGQDIINNSNSTHNSHSIETNQLSPHKQLLQDLNNKGVNLTKIKSDVPKQVSVGEFLWDNKLKIKAAGGASLGAGYAGIDFTQAHQEYDNYIMEEVKTYTATFEKRLKEQNEKGQQTQLFTMYNAIMGNNNIKLDYKNDYFSAKDDLLKSTSITEKVMAYGDLYLGEASKVWEGGGEHYVGYHSYYRFLQYNIREWFDPSANGGAVVLDIPKNERYSFMNDATNKTAIEDLYMKCKSNFNIIKLPKIDNIRNSPFAYNFALMIGYSYYQYLKSQKTYKTNNSHNQ